ncbi:MAG: hypothetical protein AAGC78_03560 [Cellvibrio sp.]
MSIDDSQLDLKRQVAWFFSGKFPEAAFDFMEASMGDNQMPLAQMLYENLTSNHPEKVFDWLQNNENDFVMLYPVAEQKFERKMGLFQALAALPDWKWTAYEAGLKLVKESMRPQDNWTSQTLAQAVAQANPMDAINYALAQHNGAVDKRLLNGALIALGKTNPVEAKRLLVENQAHLDELAVAPVVHDLMARGEFNELYSLTNSLTDKKMVETAVSNTASGLHSYGSEKVVEFIGAIKDPALKVTAVNSATSYMSVAGYPVEKQLEIIDGGLQGVPVDQKVFSYAWTIQKGYKENPQAATAYLNQMKIHNKELAVKVEDLLTMLKESQKIKSPRKKRGLFYWLRLLPTLCRFYAQHAYRQDAYQQQQHAGWFRYRYSTCSYLSAIDLVGNQIIAVSIAQRIGYQ